MTVQTPLYLQERGIPAKFDRQLLSDFFSPGVVGVSSMLASSSGAALGVNVAKGPCYVAGTQNADQGTYRAFNDAAYTVNFDPAVTYPRLDQIIVRIYDSDESGGVGADQATIEIAKGVESNGATLINRSGAVLDVNLPDNSERICDVLVPVGATPVIPAGNINDRRRFAGIRAGGAVPIGAQIPYTGAGDPGDGMWVLADGRLIDKTIYGTFFTRTGHTYNGGVDPGSNKVRVPDKRGRGSMGPANMGTAQGAATGNARAQLARGAVGGEVLHTLLGTEAAVKEHQHHMESINMGGAPPVLLSSGGKNMVAGATAGGGSNRSLSVPVPDGSFHYGIGVGGVNGGAQNASTGHNNLGPYETDNWIVRIA